MVLIELYPRITEKTKDGFLVHLFEKLPNISRSHAADGAFKHSSKSKPEFRFTGVYKNDTYKLTSLYSKTREDHQEEWTEEEVQAIQIAVQSYYAA
jgi:hypothetical protein